MADKSDDFRVERSVHIQAQPAAIFPLIEDFRRWTLWSPYEGLDPAMQRTYSGSDHGAGAAYGWQGNNKVGSGHMEILKAEAPRRVLIKLDFFKPFEGHNHAEFTLTPEDGGTRVTWAMYGPKNRNLICLIMDWVFSMDRMIGGQFESGLAKLKSVVEGPEQAAA